MNGDLPVLQLLFRFVIGVVLVAAIFAVVSAINWAFGFNKSQRKRSRLARVVGVLFGMEALLYVSGAFLFFVLGLGLSDVAVDAFWPQCNNVVWIRPVGGFASLVLFLSAIELVRKVSS
jgi:hypothetical protein